MNSTLGSKSRCLLATPVAASTKFRDAHRLCFDAPQIQLNISVSRWRLRSQQSCGAVISLDCSPPDEITKRHTEPAVYGFTCRFIRRKSASRWRADNHDDLFTVEHLVARHHSGSCRTVWTLMPARYLAKAHRHLAVVHTCLVCMRNTDVQTFGLCHFASLFDFRISQIIQIGSPHVLPHCKSVRGHRPPSNKETCLDYFVVPVSVLV